MGTHHSELGLFGYGRLGRLLAEQLADDFSVAICDPAYSGKTPQQQPFVSAPEAAARDIVVLAVPISLMEAVCCHIAPYLKPGQLLLDTCSVKILPTQVMRRCLPQGMDLIGTHPLFGPDSAKAGLAGHKIVLCPLTENRVAEVQGYLERRGLRVLHARPEEHDRAMAETQCLFHLMARALQEMGIQVGDISTPGPEKLYRDFAILQHDTLQLFHDLQSLNPYAAGLRRKFIDTLKRFDSDLTGNHS